MRDRKYRIWVEEEMVILENSGIQYYDFEGSYSLGFTVDGYSEFWAHENYDLASKEASKLPLMDFSGLQDKNKVDIYEGDIIDGKVVSFSLENATFMLGNEPLFLSHNHREITGHIYKR